MNHYYIVYDKKNKDLPIGQFDFVREIAECLNMTTTGVYAAMQRKSFIKHRYYIVKFKEVI